MGLQVNNNTVAFDVFSSYNNNLGGLKKSMARLSSGTIAITDDPSGIGISERMRSQIRSTSMARNNVENSVSMLQTADSWLQKIGDMLGRMHELIVESEDGTKGEVDIGNIQTEYQALQLEIRRITSRQTAAAKFNGLYLFRGGSGQSLTEGDTISSGTVDVQIGADLGQNISLELANLEVTNNEVIGTISSYTYSTDNSVTGSSQTAVTWASIIDTNVMSVRSSDGIGKVQTAIDHISNQRALLGAQQSRLEHTGAGLLAYEDSLRTAESKIRDIDMALESTELSKYQILTQVGTSMLTQANQIPASAVQLLG